MAKSKISQTIRKSAEGYLNFDSDNITIEIEDVGNVNFKDIFSKFNGEHAKVSISVSNEGYDADESGYCAE